MIFILKLTKYQTKKWDFSSFLGFFHVKNKLLKPEFKLYNYLFDQYSKLQIKYQFKS